MTEIVAKYKARLYGLTGLELIEELTQRAAEAERAGHSGEIAQVIVQRIEMPLPADQKLLLLYLIDSMIKNLHATQYPKLFVQNIIYIFCRVFEEADKNIRFSMYELRKEWTPIIHGQKLSTLDKFVKKMDPNWPWPDNAEPRDELIQHRCEQKQNEGGPAKAGKGTTLIAELEADEPSKENQRILHYLDSIAPDMSANATDHAALQELFMEPEVVYRETIELLFGKFRLTELLKQEHLKRAIDFLYAFTVKHFFVLHACIPGYKRNPVAMLQPGETRESAKRWYGDTLRDLGFTAVGESRFFKISKQQKSSDEMDRPMTKQCSVCRLNLGNLRSSELTPEEKNRVLVQHQMQHLEMCTQGRQHYDTLVKAAEAKIKDAKISELSQSKANTSDMKMHYSFDFAQKVQYPKEAKQKRTCEIFGVCCEGIPQQINYLIDEGVYKNNIDANLIVCLLHHFFDTYGLGEKILHLHCDNSGAQNKNNAMLRYLAWRVMEGKHEQIFLNFMPAAHSKFYPDLNFLHVKQRLEKKSVHSVDEIAREVEASRQKNINRAHVLSNDEQSRTMLDGKWFPTNRFCRFDGMKEFHHFHFSSLFPGKVHCKKKLNDQFLVCDLRHSSTCESPAQQAWSKFKDSHPNDFDLLWEHHKPSERRASIVADEVRRAAVATEGVSGPRHKNVLQREGEVDFPRHDRGEDGGHFASPRADVDNLDIPGADFDDNDNPRRDFDAHRRSQQEYLRREGPRPRARQGFPSNKRQRGFNSRDSQPLFDGPTECFTPKRPRLIAKTRIGQDGPRPGGPGPRMAGPRPFGPRGPAPNIPRPVKVEETKIIPGSPMGDPRWFCMRGLLEKEVMEEVVIDGKPYEVKMGLQRNIRAYGRVCEVYPDPFERGIRLNGKIVYKFGEPKKDVDLGHRMVELFYHGPPLTLWIDGQQHRVRLDAPPLSMTFDGTLFGFQIDGRDKMILVDQLEKGVLGGPPRPLLLNDIKHEIAFEAPARNILIDQQSCELKLDRKIPLIIYNGKPHGIRFEGGPRKMIIDDTAYLVPLDSAVKARIGNRPHFLAFGGPAHEVIIDGKWFEVEFNNVPKNIAIGNRIHSIRLEPPIPRVKILSEITQGMDESDLPNLLGQAQPGQVPRMPQPPLPPPVLTPGAKPSVTSPAADGKAAPSTELPAVKTEPVDASDVKSAEVETKPAVKAMVEVKTEPAGPQPPTAVAQQPRPGIPQQNQPEMPQQNMLQKNQANMPQPGMPQPNQQGMPQPNQPGMPRPNQQGMPRPNQQGMPRPGMPSEHFVGAPAMQRPVMPGMPMSTSTMLMSANSTPMSDNTMPMSVNSMPMSANTMPIMQATTPTPVATPAPTPTPTPTPSATVHIPSPAAPAKIPEFNELVKKLLKLGIIGKTAKTEEMAAPPAPSAPILEVKVEPQAGAAPLEQTCVDPTPRQKALEGEVAFEPPPDLSDFQSVKLKMQYSGVVHNLYRGIQCTSCGCRFLKEEMEQYRQHLDWHFRLNKRQKETAMISSSREWYLEHYDWVMFRGTEESEEYCE